MTERTLSWRGRYWGGSEDWPEGPQFDQLRKRRDLARGIAELAVEEDEALTARLTEEGRLTPAGIREKARELAQGHIAKLKLIRDGLDRHHDALDLLRDRISPVKLPDTSDPIVALTVRLEDSENRNWLLSLPHDQRVKEIHRACKDGDEAVLRAVLFVPATRIGLTEEFMQAIKSSLVRERHSDTIEEVVQLEQAIVETERFYENALGTIGDLADLPDYAGRGTRVPGGPTALPWVAPAAASGQKRKPQPAGTA